MRPRDRSAARAVDRFTDHRLTALAELDDTDRMRDAARTARSEVLANLPDILERFADTVLAKGGHICWAKTAVEARAYIAGIVRRHGARRVAKSKSMATEEIGLNVALESVGAEVIETDLGEWIVQLATEPEPHELMRFARRHLRDVFCSADIGITGANLGVAETGSVVLMTDEGNDRLVTALPKVHVVILGMDRLAATWAQADPLLTLLARSTTGQRLSSYTSVVTGTRRAYELDGPDELHIVLLDNGRGQMLGSTYPTGMDAYPVDIPLQDMQLPIQQAMASEAEAGERAPWRMWAAAWSDPKLYNATTRAATWGHWATGLAGQLPPASRWAKGRVLSTSAGERFRDRWRRGLA